MRDDYKLKGSTTDLKLQVEADVAKVLADMEKYTGYTVSELANTAIKNFITRHSDFLPPRSKN